MKSTPLTSLNQFGSDRAHQERILFQVQAGVVVVLCSGLLVGYAYRLWNSTPPVYLGLAATFVSIWLNRRGKNQAAATLLIGMLLAMELLLMIAGQGIHDITVIILPIILVMASLLLVRKAFLLVTILTILGSSLIVWLEISGRLVTETSAFTSASDAFLLAAILLLTAGVVRLLADSIVSNLNAARRRLEHLTTLNQVGQAVAAGLDLEQTLSTLHACSQSVAPNDAFSVALYNHASTELTFPIFIDLGQKIYVPPSEIRDEPGLTGEVIARRAPLYLADLHDPACLEGLNVVRVGESRIRTYLGLPLILQDEVIGVMSVQSQRARAYDAAQISLLETIAAQAAIALDNARLYAALRNELHERRIIEADLHRRDSILEAVSLAAGKFLTGADWRGGIRTVLARLGQETGAHHACICSVIPAGDENQPQIDALYDWTAHGAAPFDRHLIYPNAARRIDGLQRWLAATRAGEPYSARLFPIQPGEPVTGPQASSDGENTDAQVSSHLTAPIRVAGELWGFIGFEAAGEKVWSEIEVEAIQVAAGLLGAAIGRQGDDEYIHRLNAELEARVRERTADLESFAYSVAHDLRAPLRGIDGYSKLLLEDYAERLEGDGVVYLHNVRRAAQWMGQIIEDLLKLSRVTRVEMRTAQVDLSAIAREIAAHLDEQDRSRYVEWLIAPDLTVVGDPSLLRLALENLLHNSWKFTDHQGEARIEFSAIQCAPGGVEALTAAAYPEVAPSLVIPADAELPHGGGRVFFVRDNGAGFDMRYAEKLFSPFQRLHTSDEFEGSGVGLATVRRIYRRHNGDIWVRSARSRGACFFFMLPG